MLYYMILYHHIILYYITLLPIKTCYFVCDYNYRVSWSYFILFISVEIGINTLQFTYLMA